MRVFAVILSGGSGVRAGGDVPKQYRVDLSRTMIARAMEPFFLHPAVEAVRIVADAAWHDLILKEIDAIAADTPEDIRRRFLGFSAPGKTRALSIYNALTDLKEQAGEEDVVILHDAARPFVSRTLIDALIDACRTHDGALPVLPMKDTVYLTAQAYRRGEQGRIDSLLERDRIVAGQAPEAFLFGKYLAANEALMPERIMEISGSTQVALLAGMDIALIDGEESNYKVTSADDIRRYEEDIR